MDTTLCYQLGYGFSFRKEEFGGMLYHYEGIQPDPRLYFVDSPFLVGLLETMEANPATPLGELMQAVSEAFALDGEEQASMRDFFATLGARGAIIPRATPTTKEATP